MSANVSAAEALAYLRQRLGDVRLELITLPDGCVNGHIFKVGRSRKVFGFLIDIAGLTLFADGIEYNRNKRRQ